MDKAGRQVRLSETFCTSETPFRVAVELFRRSFNLSLAGHWRGLPSVALTSKGGGCADSPPFVSFPLSSDFRSEINFAFRDKYKSAAAGVPFPSRWSNWILPLPPPSSKVFSYPRWRKIATLVLPTDGRGRLLAACPEGGGAAELTLRTTLICRETFCEVPSVPSVRNKTEGRNKWIPLQRQDRIGSATSAKGFLSPSWRSA